MAIGYSAETIRKLKDGDRTRLGVKLGLYCVQHDISVSAIALKFGVTRATVYNWFAGICDPHRNISAKVAQYIDA